MSSPPLGLEQSLKRLMLLRVVMMTTLLLIAVYVETVSETLLPANPLYLLIAATYGLTILYVGALRFLPRWLEAQVYVQEVLDLVTVTGLVYLTGGGGTRAGFMLLYPISVLAGSVLLRRRGLILAVTATLLYASLLGAVRMRVIPPQGLSDVPFMLTKHVLYSVFVTAVACVTVALIGSYLAESLRSVGARLEEVSEEVADLRELNQAIVESIHSGLMTVDASGAILHANAFGETILGRRLVDIRGHGLREVMGTVLLDGAALAARVGNDMLERMEISYPRPDGAHVDLGLSITRLAAAPAGRGAYLVVFQNLTDIKRLEREARMNEKLAAVGEMAARLAHEIRNPLGSISGSAQVLLGEPNISAEQERLLSIITRESRRLSDALNQFLFQARPARRTGPVDLGTVIGERIELLRNGPEVRAHHRVEFRSEGGPHVCLADPDQITQVFWNLARNGLEAMPDGGLLAISVRTDGEEFVLSVRDEGRGLSGDEQRRVFEPFHSSSPMGTGLGLAIAYQIVREHHGDVRIRSVPGRGTEVEVRLPLVRVAASA